MKKVLFPTLLILISIFACKKELPPIDYYFSFTANGTEVTRDSLEFYADNLIDSILTLTFSVDDKELHFIINPYTEEGTYEDVYMNYYDGTYSYYGSGTVIVQEIDPKRYIKGTFSGQATTLGAAIEVLIENGEFMQKYDQL
jgi:hypothetical protein